MINDIISRECQKATLFWVGNIQVPSFLTETTYVIAAYDSDRQFC